MDTNRFAAIPNEKLLKQKSALKTGLYLFCISMIFFLGTIVYSAQSTGFRPLSIAPVLIMFIPLGINLYNLREIRKEIKARGLE